MRKHPQLNAHVVKLVNTFGYQPDTRKGLRVQVSPCALYLMKTYKSFLESIGYTFEQFYDTYIIRKDGKEIVCISIYDVERWSHEEILKVVPLEKALI